MFINKISFLCVALGTVLSTSACPTCVGKIHPHSPTFFSDEFYQAGISHNRETKEQVGHAKLKKLHESVRRKK